MFSFSNWNSVIKCKVKGWEISQFCIYNEIIDIHAVDQQISIKLEFDLLKDLSYKSKMEGMPCQKMAILTRKSKIFIKAKVIFMKSCLLGHVSFMIRCILKNFIFSNAICKKVHRWILKFFCLATLVWFLDYKNQ